MKRRVLSHAEAIDVKALNGDFIIGIQGYDKSKSILVKVHRNKYQFVHVGEAYYYDDTLNTMIQKCEGALDSGFDMYSFDTTKELLEWLLS